MEPISGALLYEELNGGVKKGTMSDINGAVSLSAFENANFITISHISYLNRTLEFSNITGNILLKPDSNNLDEIVISASKFSQNLKEISQRVIFISTEDVVLSNPQTSADLLSSSGNVYIQKSQLGGGSPMIRGFSTNRLALSVDGVRLNNAIFRGGNIQNVISIDPFNIQNTEIVLGSSSVIYGSDAIGGAMNFQTKKAVFSESDSIFFKLNSTSRNSSANKEKTAHIDFNMGFENFASLTSISFSDFDDLKMGANGPSDYLRPEYVHQVDGQDVILSNPDPRVQKHTGYSQFNFMQKFLLKTDKTEYDLGVHYSSTSNIPRYDRLIRYNNDTNELHYGEWYYGPQKWLLINSRITKESFNGYDYVLMGDIHKKQFIKPNMAYSGSLIQQIGILKNSEEDIIYRKKLNDIYRNFHNEIEKLKPVPSLFNEVEDLKYPKIYNPVCSLVSQTINKYKDSSILSNHYQKFLIGNTDFYKIIVEKESVDIIKYCNIPSSSRMSSTFSKNYIFLDFHNGIKMIMRLHTASSRITKNISLKFDSQMDEDMKEQIPKEILRF